MSSGDLDNHFGPPGELARLRAENQSLDRYLAWAWAQSPIRSFFIMYGAGISTNGRRIYVSNDIQADVNGHDCAPALVRHETTEWALREFCGIGEDYLNDPSGHRLANRAEAEHVAEILAMPLEEAWELYSEIIDPQVVLDMRQDLTDKPTPWDLARYPYTEEQWEKILDSMWTERSHEEWSRLTGEVADAHVEEEPEPEPAKGKVDRSAFLYMDGETEDFAQCETCVSFVRERERCMWFGEFKVDADDTCGLYVKGPQPPGRVPMALVEPEVAGFYDGPVRCENCVAFEPQGHCALFAKLNRLLPEKFDLDEQVVPYGCCNAFEPGERRERPTRSVLNAVDLEEGGAPDQSDQGM